MSEFLYHAPCPSCGSKNNLGIYSDHHYCFGCGYTKFLNPLLRFTEQEKKPIKSLWLPDDIEPRIPYEAQEWLNRYTLTPMELLRNKIVWSESQKLLIFLYTKESVVIAWQGRYFGTSMDKPKWWSQGNLKELDLVISPVSFGMMLTQARHTTQTSGQTCLVLVEDIVSAIKVGRQYDCKPLFGSFIDIAKLYNFVKGRYNTIYIWLDNDKYKEAHRFAYKLSNLGIKVRVLNTKQDPKELDNNTIKVVYESASSNCPIAA